MPFYWFFLMLAIVLALFSDRIDKAANANKGRRNGLIGVCVVLALGTVVLIAKSLGLIYT